MVSHGPGQGNQAALALGQLPVALRQLRSHPWNKADEPGEGEGEQKERQGEQGDGGRGREAEGGEARPAEDQQPQRMDQVDAKGVSAGAAQYLPAGPLLADAKYIAEQGAEGGGGEEDVGAGGGTRSAAAAGGRALSPRRGGRPG